MFEKKTKLVEPNIKKEVMDSPSCMYFSDLEDKSDVEEPKPVLEKKTVKDSLNCMYFSNLEDESDVEEPIKVTARIQKEPHSSPSEIPVAVIKSHPIIKKSATLITVPR